MGALQRGVTVGGVGRGIGGKQQRSCGGRAESKGRQERHQQRRRPTERTQPVGPEPHPPVGEPSVPHRAPRPTRQANRSRRRGSPPSEPPQPRFGGGDNTPRGKHGQPPGAAAAQGTRQHPWPPPQPTGRTEPRGPAPQLPGHPQDPAQLEQCHHRDRRPAAGSVRTPAGLAAPAARTTGPQQGSRPQRANRPRRGHQYQAVARPP